MNNYGEVIAEDAVRFTRLLPGPIERVWSYLVDGDKRGRWLCSGDTDSDIGGTIHMVFRNNSLSSQPDVAPPDKHRDLPEEMSFRGEITAYDPPRLFSHTWEFENEHSHVEYALEERGDKVLLTLTHTRLDGRDMKVDVSGGWHTHLDLLEDVLNGREPRAFWKRYIEMDELYSQRIAP